MTITHCTRCSAELLFSARSRGDGLCGPCSRAAAGESTVMDRLSALERQVATLQKLLANLKRRTGNL